MADTILDRMKRGVAQFYHLALVYDADPPTIVDGDVRPAQMDANGALKVAVVGGVAMSGGATEATIASVLTKLGAGLGAALSSGGGAKVGIVDSVAIALAAGSSAIGSVLANLRVAGADVSTGNPIHVDGATGALFDVKDRAARALGVVTGAAGSALALDSTLTGGTQVANPSPSTPASSGGAYEGSRVLKASAGTFRSLFVQLDPALAGGTYYVQLLTASASVPTDGAVTFLRPPQTVVHTLGQAESANFYDGDAGIAFTVGCTACVSSTQFTKTEVASSALFAGSVL